MKINLELIDSFGPSQGMRDNFTEKHPGWEGSPLELLELDDVPAGDIQWLLLRTDFITEEELHLYAIFCAEQELPFFERGRPGDKRPHKAIEAKKRWLKDQIGDEALKIARIAAIEAYNSACYTYATARLADIALNAYSAATAACAAFNASSPYDAATAAYDTTHAAYNTRNAQLDELKRIFKDKGSGSANRVEKDI